MCVVHVVCNVHEHVPRYTDDIDIGLTGCFDIRARVLWHVCVACESLLTHLQFVRPKFAFASVVCISVLVCGALMGACVACTPPVPVSKR